MIVFLSVVKNWLKLIKYYAINWFKGKRIRRKIVNESTNECVSKLKRTREKQNEAIKQNNSA